MSLFVRNIILFIFVFFHLNGFSQSYDTYWNYDISDGLPTNSIYNILIDSKGKIWFGSDLGVTCYDGQKFKTYTTDDGLVDNTVLRCFEDRSGKIWFHHNNRVPSYYENGEVHQISTSKKDILVSSSSEFTQTSNGKIYLGCSDGFLIIDESLKTQYLKEDSNDNFSIVGSRDDLIYLFSDAEPTKKLRTINFDHTFQYSKNDIINISVILTRSADYTFENYFSNNKHILIDPKLAKLTNYEGYFLRKYDNVTYYSTGNGIYVFELKNGQLMLQNHILEGKKINSISFDENGNLWATSLGNGLYFFPRNGITTIPLDSKKKIISQFKYNNSVLYGFNFGGIMKSNGKSLSLFTPLNSNEFKSVSASNIYYDEKGHYLIDDGLILSYRLENETFKKISVEKFSTHKTVKSSFDVRYFLTSHKGIATLDPYKKELKYWYSKIMGKSRKIVEFNHEMYIATQLGLFKLINNEPINVFQKELKDTRVNDILEFNGNLIISTGDNGIWLYNGKLLQNFSTKDGLISNQVTFLSKTNRGTIWLTTKLGLQEIKIIKDKIVEIKRFDLKTNILNSEIEDLDDIGDFLMLTTENGLYSLDNTVKQTLTQLKLFVEEFRVNSKNFNIQNDIIEYGDNIKIVTSAPNFSKHATEYFYRLNGSDWVKNNSETFTFLQLSPGDYKLEIFVKSVFFKDSDIKTIEFSVNEKWYQNIYLIIIGFLLVTIAIILIIRNRSLKRSERKRNELKTELLSLQSQMNPHFTFNSLNSIQSYMSTHNMREAQIYLADFANLMRSILEQAKLDLISLEKEVNFLTAYLDLEKRRLESQFDYSIHVEPSIEPSELALPSLLLQPFVENAIWHGVAGLDYKGKISVRFKADNSQLICEIEDNGLGLEAESKRKKSRPYHKSQGIQNCKERINLFQEIYHKNIELNIESKDTLNHGTIVIVKFPIIKQNETRNEF